jgi:hypothetical protein
MIFRIKLLDSWLELSDIDYPYVITAALITNITCTVI